MLDFRYLRHGFTLTALVPVALMFPLCAKAEPLPTNEVPPLEVAVHPYAGVGWATVRQSKANLHTHSTQSDGSLTVPVVIDSYHALGYEVLAMTDHNKVTWPWSSHGRDWDGMMDDSGIWGRALDASEVFALYNLGQTGQALTTAITTHVKADNTTALSLGGPWDTGNPPATADFLVFNSDFAQAGALDTGAPMAGAGLRVSGGSGLIDTNNPSGVLTLGNLGQPIR